MARATARSCVMKSKAKPCSACRRVSSSRTEACTETSRAETASSAMRTRGRVARARAIATRWRSPPDRRTGRRIAYSAGRSTAASRSGTSLAGRPATAAASASVWPMVRAGLRAE